jgi:hypothetical protein
LHETVQGGTVMKRFISAASMFPPGAETTASNDESDRP